MARKLDGTHPKYLAVYVKPRNREDRERIAAQYDALQLAARWAGFNSYGEMTRHFWERMVASTVDVLDGYTVMDAVVRNLTERVHAAAGRRIKVRRKDEEDDLPMVQSENREPTGRLVFPDDGDRG